MKVNVPYKKLNRKINTFRFKKRIIFMSGILFLVLFIQAVYVIQVSVNVGQLNTLINNSNQLKVENQLLEGKIAQAQNLQYVQTLAENKFSMQAPAQITYLNSQGLVSYNN